MSVWVPGCTRCESGSRMLHTGSLKPCRRKVEKALPGNERLQLLHPEHMRVHMEAEARALPSAQKLHRLGRRLQTGSVQAAASMSKRSGSKKQSVRALESAPLPCMPHPAG